MANNVGVVLNGVLKTITTSDAGGDVHTQTFGPAAVPIGGATPHHRVAAGSGDATVVNAGACKWLGVNVSNGALYKIYVKFYDTASSPTPGSGTIIKCVGVQAGIDVRLEFPVGIQMASGLAYTIVKELANTGSTAVDAGACSVGIEYKA